MGQYLNIRPDIDKIISVVPPESFPPSVFKQVWYNAKMDNAHFVTVLKELLNALEIMNAGKINLTIEELMEMKKTKNIKKKVINISELILIGEFDDAAKLVKNLLIEELDRI